MKKIFLTYLMLIVLSSVAYAHGKKHVHGEGRLDVAVDKGNLSLNLELPLDVAVGFERKPKNDKEKATLEAAGAQPQGGGGGGGGGGLGGGLGGGPEEMPPDTSPEGGPPEAPEGGGAPEGGAPPEQSLKEEAGDEIKIIKSTPIDGVGGEEILTNFLQAVYHNQA